MKYQWIALAAAAALLFSGCAARGNGGNAGSGMGSVRVSSQAGVSSAASEQEHPSSAAVSASSNVSKTVSVAVYKKPFPVLMYHSIAYEKGNPLRVPGETFDRQMKWLHDNGYQAVTLDALYAEIEKGKPFPEKQVAVTFDDGYADAYTTAFPILKKYGFKATIFMIAGDVGQASWLTAAQLREMSNYGIAVESHTVTHPHLNTLSYEKQLLEMTRARAELEAITGKTVLFLAYPYGDYNAGTEKAARAAGYHMAFTMSGPWDQKPSAILYTFPRVYITSDMSGFEKGVETGKTAEP